MRRPSTMNRIHIPGEQPLDPLTASQRQHASTYQTHYATTQHKQTDRYENPLGSSISLKRVRSARSGSTTKGFGTVMRWPCRPPAICRPNQSPFFPDQGH